MTKTVITGARVWDGLYNAVYPATVTIDGNCFNTVNKSSATPEDGGMFGDPCGGIVGCGLIRTAE